MEFVSVTNVPYVDLFLFLSDLLMFPRVLRHISSHLERNFSRDYYLFYGVYDLHHSRRKLLCSFDFNGLDEVSSIA